MRSDDFATAHPYLPAENHILEPDILSAPTISYKPINAAARLQELPKRHKASHRAGVRPPLMPGQLYGEAYQEKSRNREDAAPRPAYEATASSARPNGRANIPGEAGQRESFTVPTAVKGIPGVPGETSLENYQQNYWNQLHKCSPMQQANAPAEEAPADLPEYLKQYRAEVWKENPSLHGVPVEWPEWHNYDGLPGVDNTGYHEQMRSNGQMWAPERARGRANDARLSPESAGYSAQSWNSGRERIPEGEYAGIADSLPGDMYEELLFGMQGEATFGTPTGLFEAYQSDAYEEAYGQTTGGAPNGGYSGSANGMAERSSHGEYGDASSGAYWDTPSGQYGRPSNGAHHGLIGGMIERSPNGGYGDAPRGSYRDTPNRANRETHSEQYGRPPNGTYDGSSNGVIERSPNASLNRSPSGSYRDAPNGAYRDTPSGQYARPSYGAYDGSANGMIERSPSWMLGGSSDEMYRRLPNGLYERVEIHCEMADWVPQDGVTPFFDDAAPLNNGAMGVDSNRLPPPVFIMPQPPVYIEAPEPYIPPKKEPVDPDESDDPKPSSSLFKVVLVCVIVVLLAFCGIQIGRIVMVMMRNEEEMKAIREDYLKSVGKELAQNEARVDLLPPGVTYAPTQAAPAQSSGAPAVGGYAANDSAASPFTANQIPGAGSPGGSYTDPESMVSLSQRSKVDQYESNAQGDIRAPFVELHNSNADIVGHLMIGDFLDELVMFKNNTYYFSRNVHGNADIAGAVFIDELCKITSPPENLILRGQSSVEGKLLAPLHQYLDGGVLFLRQNALIRMDTIYEEGEYVIFAVFPVLGDPQAPGYFNYAGHSTFPNDREMERYVNRARQYSRYDVPVDVLPSDRLLTICTLGNGAAKEGLVIMARKLRPGETVVTLNRILGSISEK